MYDSGKLPFAILMGVLLAMNLASDAQSKSSSNATTKPEDKDLVLRVQVRRVPVDVIVLDKHGNPVHGLKKEDFQVKEDDKSQRVLSFESYDGSAPSYVPPKSPSLPANTFVDLPSAPERGPLYILYYDMVNTPPGDQMAFREELIKFIDNAQPGTRIALFVNARGLHLLQGFTTDHALLREAAVRKGPGPHVPNVFTEGNTFGRYDAGAALSNLNFISDYLGGIPERKNLIWLSTYFPIPVGPTLVGTSSATASQAPQLYSLGAQGGPQVLDLSELLADSIRHTYAAMMRSQIALYPVSFEGVRADANPGDAINVHQNMDLIARATGGHAYYSDNRESLLIEKALEDGETYYTLTYAPSNTKYDG